MTLAAIHSCVIIPTYNNEKTLQRVISGILEYAQGVDVIVINDGSTDSTSQILSDFSDKVQVISYPVNQGKGYALRQGFAEAIRRGYTYALSIDSDGQHLPSDIPHFLEAAAKHPGALIMGSRNMEQEGVPAKSSFGNKFSNFWFQFETGIALPDTQTGYRLYPLKPIGKIRLRTSKFETEIEVIVKLAWLNVPIIPVNIQVIYDKNERVTHFRPFRDFTRISILNTWLVILTLLYYLPARLFRKIHNRGLWTIIREEAFRSDETNFKKAISIGFGFFMGIVPIWGFQLLIGIPLAIFFKMNKVLFVTAANISLPPMIPLIIFISYRLGGLFFQDTVEISSFRTLTLASIHLNFVQYATGGVLLAFITGLLGMLFSWIGFRIFRKTM
jgi:glycosyltransferase involved in cell wall biosynthesis